MPALPGSVLTLPRLLLAAAFFCGCTIAGLFTSSFFRILPSIGMAGLVLTSLVCYWRHRAAYRRCNAVGYGSFLLVYAVHVFSGLLLDTLSEAKYKQDVVLQLPFLLLPLAFWLLPPLPTRYLRGLWMWFIALTVCAAAYSTGNYLLHQEEINGLYLQSKVMPTEPDHIRFSLMVTLAVAVGSILLAHRAVAERLRPWVLTATLSLALFQHLLAVRSGLLTLYIVGGVAVLWLAIRLRRFRPAAGLLSLLLLLPIVGYVCFPTFRNKFTNTREDIDRVEHTASANNYSLVGRVYSYRVAYKVFGDNPWLGVGKANMEAELAARYKQDFPNINPQAYILPHNQYLYAAVAFGLVGVLLFMFGFYYAGVSIWPAYAPILVTQYLIVTLSFLVEYTVETQIGIAFSLFFLLLALEGSKPSAADGWRPR
ncbi:O-antigen ligase family protein [Hymenobacter weizhouensis]|uniref:O-antigen ligase family protein n=1 Tax=Hymenobacter sp. YIM 151500-1 TaxID=2987689 RepID=UPI002226B737|nr:O-antigen ligase family protein [Hymenobacter sp. YIM 151500-1]UYZ62882.1 O-antigen ligase family protein [Hymenobacter sp. YIM 151500-1]